MVLFKLCSPEGLNLPWLSHDSCTHVYTMYALITNGIVQHILYISVNVKVQTCRALYIYVHIYAICFE